MRDCLTTKDGSLNLECEEHRFILEKQVPAEGVSSPILPVHVSRRYERTPRRIVTETVVTYDATEAVCHREPLSTQNIATGTKMNDSWVLK